jgi:apolipoprotein N-acyltransferase
MALALPNEFFRTGIPVLGFIALIPLYFALMEIPSYGRAALLTGIYGALHHALSSYWLYFFKDFAFWTIGGTTLAYFIVYAVLGLYLGLALKRTDSRRSIVFALFWTVFEFRKSSGFLGYPWGLIPYSLTEVLPLLQIADITGLYGLSFVLSFANAALAESIRGFRAKSRLVLAYPLSALCLVGVLALYGAFRLAIPIPEIGRFDAILVQQNIDPWKSGEEAALATNVHLAREALQSAPRPPDLIIFSETTLGRPYLDFRAFYETRPKGDPLIPFIRSSKAWLFTGAPVVLDWETQTATNSVILIDPQARQIQEYAKVHPVPFAEAIPFWDIPWFKNFMQNTVGLESGWVMGTRFTVFDLPGKSGNFKFGAPICFEDAFAEVCMHYFRGGADFLLNLTNDSWSRTVSAELQHWAAARFRSIENRRTLVRSTNGGYSCVVDAYGRVIMDMPLFESTSRFVEVPVFKEDSPTVYLRFGDWFAQAILLLSIVWVIILIAEDGNARPARRRRTK